MEWVAISFFRGSFWPRDQTQVSCIAGRLLTTESAEKPQGVYFCSVTKLCPNSLRSHGLQHARLPCPSLPWSLLKLMCFESIMPSNHLILYHPLLLLSSVFPSIRVFSNVSTLHIRWPKYWSFRLSISPFNEYSGLISSRIDWFDLLTVQGTL